MRTPPDAPGARFAAGRALGIALLLIVLTGVATRLLPLTKWAIWGSDSGEYVFLTERLVETGRISFEYDGWGLAYPYFPGMFVLDGAVALFLGADVLAVQRLLVPSLAALTALFVFLLAREVLPDPRVGLVAAGFLAVTAPHTLVTSHAMPGTLGHLFLLGSLLCVVRAYREPAWATALPFLALALLLTHHLTLYFLVGAVAAVALLRELVRGRPANERLRIEAPFVAGLVVLASVWWLVVAAPFRDRIVAEVLYINPWLFAAGASALLLVVPPALVAARRRFLPPLRTSARWPSPRFILVTAGGLFAALVAFIAMFLVVPVPGGVMRIDATTVVYLPPVAAFLAFAVAGGRVLRLAPLGAVVSGWLAAIFASLAFAIVTDSRVLFPFRHVEYFMEPLAIYVGAGVVAGADHLARLRPGRLVRQGLVAAVALGLVVGAAASFPPRQAIANFEEGMSHDEVAAVRWAGENLPDTVVIAADHRTSSLLYGLAHRTSTFDYADLTFHSARLADAVGEMREINIPENPRAKITHVFISPEMRLGVALEQFSNAEPMTEAAQAKFEDARYFRAVYGDVKDRERVVILEVDWAAIDRDFPP